MPLLTEGQLLQSLRTLFLKKSIPAKGLPAASTAGIAVIELAKGVTYHGIVLHANDTTPNDLTDAEWESMVDKVVVKVDGVPLFTRSGKELVRMDNKWHLGDVISNGDVLVPFAEPWMETVGGQDQPAWGMVGRSSVELEVHVNATHDITNLFARELRGEPEELGAWVERRRITRSTGSTGEDTFELPTDPSGLSELARVAISKASIDLSEVTLNAGRIPVVDHIEPDELHQVAKWWGKTEQSDLVIIDLVQRGRWLDGIPMNLSDLNMILNWGTAPNSHEILLDIVHYEETRAERLAKLRSAA